MTFQELKTMRALLQDSISKFKQAHNFYDEDDIDTLCMTLSQMFWLMFGREHLNQKGFYLLISNSIKRSF